jgi:hypothetical protein
MSNEAVELILLVIRPTNLIAKQGVRTMDSLQPRNDQLDCWPLMGAKHPSSIMTARAFLAAKRCGVTIGLIVLMTCALVGVRFAAADDVPSAIIELSGGSVALGIGFSWGSGTLDYEGQKYAFKADGLSIIHVGASGYTASGVVYNLHKLSDFNGVYTAVSAGVAVAGGASAIAMRNSQGVVIKMTSAHAGLNFSLGPKGVTLNLQ